MTLEVDTPIETTTETNEYPDSLFDDAEETVDTPIEEETATEEETEEPVEEQEVVEEKPQTLRLKYNGEIKEVTLDEAIALAQKGMNYDKKIQELDNLKNSRELQLINRLAKESNLSVDEYLNNVEKQFEQQTIAKIGNELRKKYPNADRDTLEELAKSQYALIQQDKKYKEIEEAQKQELNEEEIEQKNDEELTQMLNEFLEEYPDVNLEEELKNEELAQLLEKGESLLSAYRKIENRRLKAQLEAQRLNNKNKAKSTGSIKGDAKSIDSDAFKSGFWG